MDGRVRDRLGIVFNLDGRTILPDTRRILQLTDVQASTFNYPGMIVTRLFLGIFESGFGPAIPLYFCEFIMCPSSFTC